MQRKLFVISLLCAMLICLAISLNVPTLSAHAQGPCTRMDNYLACFYPESNELEVCALSQFGGKLIDCVNFPLSKTPQEIRFNTTVMVTPDETGTAVISVTPLIPNTSYDVIIGDRDGETMCTITPIASETGIIRPFRVWTMERFAVTLRVVAPRATASASMSATAQANSDPICSALIVVNSDQPVHIQYGTAHSYSLMPFLVGQKPPVTPVPTVAPDLNRAK